jgi:hypothetical protein
MGSIPTKVGIQKNMLIDYWIPASAGMVASVRLIMRPLVT